MALFTLFISGLFGLFGVAFGAYSTHGLAGKISEQAFGYIQTGLLYQFLHTIALFSLGLYLHKNPSTLLNLSALGFILGIICFSFSLYGLAIFNWRPWDHITPTGGFLLMFGWLMVIIFAVKKAF